MIPDGSWFKKKSKNQINKINKGESSHPAFGKTSRQQNKH